MEQEQEWKEELVRSSAFTARIWGILLHVVFCRSCTATWQRWSRLQTALSKQLCLSLVTCPIRLLQPFLCLVRLASSCTPCAPLMLPFIGLSVMMSSSSLPWRLSHKCQLLCASPGLRGAKQDGHSAIAFESSRLPDDLHWSTEAS